MSTIQFKATLFKPDTPDQISSGVLVRLPESASKKLPSRGMTLVKGSMNGAPFTAVLEPDGQGSHWFKINDTLREATKTDIGDTATLSIEPSKEWPEPKVPEDLKNVLATDPEAQALWEDITPMARWDWIRWIGAVKQSATRKRRVDSIRSRLQAGKRRPCCFDRTQCTLTDA